MYSEIEIGAAPLSLNLALAVPAEGTLRIVRVQNRGPSTVYLSRGTTQPVPGQIRGQRHPSGDTWRMIIYSADIGTSWAWTGNGDATLVTELTD